MVLLIPYLETSETVLLSIFFIRVFIRYRKSPLFVSFQVKGVEMAQSRPIAIATASALMKETGNWQENRVY